MTFFRQRIGQITLLSMLVALGLLPHTQAIAKPESKPSRFEIEQNLSQSQTIPGRQIWQDLLSDIQDQYRDVPENRFSLLRGDDAFRNQLFSLFWGQTGDRQTIQEILVDVLLNGIRGQDAQGHYFYDIDHRCLPPGQQQRLASGKPVPPGILQKCGRPIFRNY